MREYKLAGLLDKDAKCNTQGRIPWIDNMRGFTILTVFMYIVFAFVPNDSWEFLALGRTALMMPAYLIGMLLKKYFADFRRYNTWFIVSGVICIGVELLLAIRGIVPIYWSTHDYNGNNMQYVMKLLYICFFAFFEFALLSICVTNKRCILTKWGENSLIIYLIHVLFLDILKTFMISRFGIYWLYWRKWMFPVVILLTALLVQFLSLDIWKRIYDIIFSIPQSIWKKISSSKKS